MTITNLTGKLRKILASQSTFIMTLIIYITLMFVSLAAFVELRRNVINEVTIVFLLVIEIQIVLNFIIGYSNLLNAVRDNKWINLSGNIIIFILNLVLVLQSLNSLISQSSVSTYAILLLLTSFSIFFQNYIGDKKGKNYLFTLVILSLLFVLIINFTNFIYGNPILGTNQFFINQKQLNDLIYGSSLLILATFIYTFFNIVRLYISSIVLEDISTPHKA
jgi:hypothetical protein